MHTTLSTGCGQGWPSAGGAQRMRRIPGGVMTPAQWLTFDDLATTHGNNTLRITTRQSIQFHGIVMAGLGPLIKKINDCLLSTLAACGDVNRNVTAPSNPPVDDITQQIEDDAFTLTRALLPNLA